MKLKSLIAIVAAGSLCSSMSAARSEQLPNMYTATTATVTTTTTLGKETIQSLGKQAEKSSNTGKTLSQAALVVTTAGAAITCLPSTPSDKCPVFLAGIAVSGLVLGFMGSSSNQSSGTVQAVTATSDPYNLNGASTTAPSATSPATPDYSSNPDYQKAIDTLKRAKANGWDVDVNKGTIKSPTGKIYNTSMLKSADSMRAAGISESAIKAYDSAMAKVPALAAEKAKSADSQSDLYGDTPTGGGGKTSSSYNAGADPNAGLAAGPKLGIDRDPAQVAGMSKTFNGEPIGVSQDSLFKMIDRRYDLHTKNGSFLSP